MVTDYKPIKELVPKPRTKSRIQKCTDTTAGGIDCGGFQNGFQNHHKIPYAYRRQKCTDTCPCRNKLFGGFGHFFGHVYVKSHLEFVFPSSCKALLVLSF